MIWWFKKESGSEWVSGALAVTWPGNKPASTISLTPHKPKLEIPAVVDDLLSAFLGLSGTYIRAKKVDALGGTRLGYEIITRGQLEPALQEMAGRMLPLW